MSIPTGWILAPDNDDSLKVIMSNPWSTTILLTSGNAYGSLSFSSPGYNFGSGYLSSDGTYYYPAECDSQILIRQ
jgi:hypothetical protein